MPKGRDKQKKAVEALTHDEARRRNLPSAEHQPLMREEEQTPVRVAYERRNRDLDPQFGVAGQGRAGSDRPSGQRTAALHSGEGPPQGAHRRPYASVAQWPQARRVPDRHVRRLQWPAFRGR